MKQINKEVRTVNQRFKVSLHPYIRISLLPFIYGYLGIF
jgi:hypothetical protein